MVCWMYSWSWNLIIKVFVSVVKSSRCGGRAGRTSSACCGTTEWKLCKQWKEKLCEEVRRRKRDKEGVFLHNKVQYLDCHDDIGKFYSGRNPLGLHGIRV